MTDFTPAHLQLPPGELQRRAAEAVAALGGCRLCPRAVEFEAAFRIAEDLGPRLDTAWAG